MGTKRWIAALLALWLGANAGSLCAAKPPDLPADNAVRCQDTEAGSFESAAPDDDTDAPVCIDAWCTQALPLIAQRVCQRIFAILQPGTAETERPRTQAVEAAPEDAARSAVDPRFAATAEKARALYTLASRCAREGKRVEACAHLREAHLANPTCRFGRLAIERLQELETLPPGEESQSDDDEAMQSERAFRRMRDTTQPLGLVPRRTY